MNDLTRRGTAVHSSPARFTEDGWRLVHRMGGVVALVALAALLFDIVLATVPGWEPSTAPVTVQAWFSQFASNPWLGLRNLDLLNVAVSAISLPMYVALSGAHRRTEPALALLALLFVSAGTVLFAAGSAALPMLQLSARYASAAAGERAALEGAAAALLARGAHASLGAFPAFLLSEIGTLLMALAILRGGVFRPIAGWVGIVGAASLAAYTAAMTFVPGAGTAVLALAAPGGLLMLAWHAMVARGLFGLASEQGRARTGAGGASPV